MFVSASKLRYMESLTVIRWCATQLLAGSRQKNTFFFSFSQVRWSLEVILMSSHLQGASGSFRTIPTSALSQNQVFIFLKSFFSPNKHLLTSQPFFRRSRENRLCKDVRHSRAVQNCKVGLLITLWSYHHDQARQYYHLC
jgi:hypothetical protein